MPTIENLKNPRQLRKSRMENRRQYSKYFKINTRENGSQYTTKTDDCPKDLEQLIYDIHKEFDAMPNNWIYSQICFAFDNMETPYATLEDCTIEADCYNSDLYKWLGEPYAVGFIEEYSSEFSNSKDIYTLIAGGQWLAITNIYTRVSDFINGEGK